MLVYKNSMVWLCGEAACATADTGKARHMSDAWKTRYMSDARNLRNVWDTSKVRSARHADNAVRSLHASCDSQTLAIRKGIPEPAAVSADAAVKRGFTGER